MSYIFSSSAKSIYNSLRYETRQVASRLLRFATALRVTGLSLRLHLYLHYHRHGRNVGMFTKLDRWVRKRGRAYIHRCWRHDLSESASDELDRMKLFTMRSILRPRLMMTVRVWNRSNTPKLLQSAK